MSRVEVDRACPVVLRESGGLEVLAFEHPLAGLQLVKGRLEPGESPRRQLSENCLKRLGFEPKLFEISGFSSTLRRSRSGRSTNANPARRCPMHGHTAQRTTAAMYSGSSGIPLPRSRAKHGIRYSGMRWRSSDLNCWGARQGKPGAEAKAMQRWAESCGTQPVVIQRWRAINLDGCRHRPGLSARSRVQSARKPARTRTGDMPSQARRSLPC